MSRITTLLLLICFNAGLSYGMQCSFGNKNIISKLIDSCPGLLDSADKSYCCYDFERNVYCCDATEFTLQSSWFLLTVILTVVCAVALIGFCLSCLCCSCCPWYRRRHRGTVYGSMLQVPSMVHVIQPPASVPQATPNYTNPTYPINSAGVSQPPTYSQVVYAKQAPYNPNYILPIQQ